MPSFQFLIYDEQILNFDYGEHKRSENILDFSIFFLI